MDGIVSWLMKFVLSTFRTVVHAIETALLNTPQVTGLPQVQAMTGRSVVVVDTVFVLVFTAAAGLTIVAGGNERARYEVKDLIPRAVVGFIAAHFSPLFISKAIETTNALVGTFSVDNVDQSGALKAITDLVTAVALQDPLSQLLMVILDAIIIVLLVSMAFGLLTRIIVLLVLASIAPLALALHALPQTDGIARVWWRTLGGCLITPLLQAFCLQAAEWMLLDPKGMLPMLGIPGDPGALMNLLLVIMVLFATVKVPSLVKKYLMRGAPPHNMFAGVMKTVVVQQAARAVGIPAVPSIGGRK